MYCSSLHLLNCPIKLLEPQHDKTNKMTCAPSEDSDQSGHPPSLIRVFTVRMKKSWVFSYPLSAQWRLIRLGGCPDWSESSLGAQVILLVLSWCDTFFLLSQYQCILSLIGTNNVHKSSTLFYTLVLSLNMHKAVVNRFIKMGYPLVWRLYAESFIIQTYRVTTSFDAFSTPYRQLRLRVHCPIPLAISLTMFLQQ